MRAYVLAGLGTADAVVMVSQRWLPKGCRSAATQDLGVRLCMDCALYLPAG